MKLSYSIMTSDQLKWITVHSFTFTLGTIFGLLIGKIASELFFLFILPFPIFVLLGQFLLMKDNYDWTNDWIMKSTSGFLIGSILALIQIFALLNIVGLIVNHTISLFLIASTTLFIQFRVLNNHQSSSIATAWVIRSILSLIIAILVVGIINQLHDLQLDSLVVAFESYTILLEWSAIGVVFGSIYGILTSNVMNSSEN